MVSLRQSYAPIPAHLARYERFYREIYEKFYDSVQHHLRATAAINEAFDDAGA